MSCTAWQDLLQRHLDEGGPGEDLARHVAACPDCAAHGPALRRLLAGVSLLRPAIPPAGLRDRVMARLLAEPRVSRRLVWRSRVLPLAAAAALLLAFGVWAWRQEQQPPQADVDTRALAAAPAEPLRESMEQASDAVAALTSRTASETMEHTSVVLPLVRQSAQPFADVPAALDPPLESFREATQGVSAGLAPVADSARRAVGLFLRDLPMGP